MSEFYIPDFGKLEGEKLNKLMSLFSNYINSLDIANILIIKSHKIHNEIINSTTLSFLFNTMYIHYFKINELIVHCIKSFIDRMIGLTYYIYSSFQNNIQISSIGDYLNKKDQNFSYFDNYIDYFDKINNLDNAYKHTVFNSIGGINKDNTITINYSYRNIDVNNPTTISIKLDDLINNFNNFYLDLFSIITNLCN